MKKVTAKEEFENIKKGDEVIIHIKNPVQGMVVENNLNQKYIQVDEMPMDTTVKYDQISSIEII